MIADHVVDGARVDLIARGQIALPIVRLVHAILLQIRVQERLGRDSLNRDQQPKSSEFGFYGSMRSAPPGRPSLLAACLRLRSRGHVAATKPEG
jgi:hypothetical protein